MKQIPGVALLIGLGFCSVAFAGQQNGGLAASYLTPKGDFKQQVDNGLGISAIFDYPLAGIINISGALGWNRFSGITLVEGTNVKAESLTIWEFAAGPQIDFGRMYLGVEGGYYTNLDEWGLVPNMGIRKGMMDFSIRYKMTDDGKFVAGRAGFFF